VANLIKGQIGPGFNCGEGKLSQGFQSGFKEPQIQKADYLKDCL